MTELHIYGAGMAGLLAGNMLRRHTPVIIERQASLPHNHAALLRFRTDAVSRVTGIPFRRVEVSKMIRVGDQFTNVPTPRLMNLYSRKVLGRVASRSIMNMEPGIRYIAPPNFLEQMARNLTIQYGTGLTSLEGHSVPSISTIPMPMLMNIAKWDARGAAFNSRAIWTLRVEILEPEVEAYQTIYYPEESFPFYRASMTGNTLIIEAMQDLRDPGMADMCREIALYDFGFHRSEIITRELDVQYQLYGKLLPSDQAECRSFITAMTDQYALYSLGRFATWRQILLDDIVHDVEVIERMITTRDRYQQRLTYTRKDV